ncbi:MAG: TRAP transporter substrate-binding protein [Alphaproteobacteria bacterium]|nr:TRAP transporter substrate-binding protein [Alphaproteobacteria bacterium]
MRNAIIGIIIGTVVGVVIGATFLAPRLNNLSTSVSGEQIEHLSPPTAETVAVETSAPEISWRMASAYAGALPQIGTLAVRVSREIWRISGGEMEVNFHEPDTLVPTAELFNAVKSGTIDAAFASPGLWQDDAPALQLFSSVPFGPPPSEFMAWFYFGGGRELYRDIYRRRGVHGIVCGIIAPEASGWFRNEVLTVEDLQGLKARFLGLGARVLNKLGVETLSLRDDEIFPALESGALDAAEFSLPSVDYQLGIHKMAKHYYFPGWHQPSTLLELMVNLEQWEALSPTAKARVETVCGDNIRHGLAETEATQFAALKNIYSTGVEIHRWPAEIIAALEQAWLQVAAEQSDENKDFKRVWNSLKAFREDYSIWRELGRP